VLYGNEAFAIGMLQTVSLAASIALGSQLGNVSALVGRTVAPVLLSALLLALALAVVAAFFRHQYKMFGVKAPLATGDERVRRYWWANFYLTGCAGLWADRRFIVESVPTGRPFEPQ
jgi:hypothetical protein